MIIFHFFLYSFSLHFGCSFACLLIRLFAVYFRKIPVFLSIVLILMNMFSFIVSEIFKVDKEDIIQSDVSQSTGKMAQVNATTLPSQPLDFLFIEKRGMFLHFAYIC